MITRKDKLRSGQVIALLFEGKRRVYDVTFLRFRKFGFVEVRYVSARMKERWVQVPAECLYLKG